MSDLTPDTPDSPDEVTGADMVPFGGADAATVREETTKARTELLRRTRALEAEQKQRLAQLEDKRRQVEAELERQRRELQDELARQRAEMEAVMKPLREQLEKFTEVAHAADLYLGRSEHMQVVRDGEPAPADTPIVLRQTVLVMAEEAAILTDPGTTGLDFTQIDTFIDWLQDEDHMVQLLPDPKCVVVMIPTRVKSRTGNVFEDIARDEENSTSYWLFRCGGRVTMMTTNLHVTDRLVPKRDEFTEFFTTSSGTPLVPGSDAWLAAEKGADARRRHYMKVMLTLQGVVDRTDAWAPLPPNGVNLLSVSSQDNGSVVIVNETDHVLTDGREPFREWQARLNAQLRPGHRIIAAFDAYKARTALYPNREGGKSRLHPATASAPEAGVLYTIEDRRDRGLAIRYERTDTVWKRNVPIPDEPGWVWKQAMVPATKRASCVLYPGDSWVLPFDLVTADDLRYYLGSRAARTEFLDMVPVVKAALAAKDAEAAAEAPFRDLLARMLVDAGADPDTARADLDGLVHDWKVANTYGRALTGDPTHEKRAATQIVAAYTARQDAAKTADRMVQVGRTVPGVICVAATKQGQWRAYAPTPNTPDEGVFLDVTVLHKNGTVGDTTRETVVPVRSASALTVAWSSPEWDDWNFAANRNHYLTAAERDTLVQQLRDDATHPPVCVVEYFDPRDPGTRAMGVYTWDDALADPEVEANTPRYQRHPNPIGFRGGKVVKNKDGVHVDTTTMPRSRSDRWYVLSGRFDHYGVPYRGLSGIPWWPLDPVSYEERPRLVWVDDTLIDRMTAHNDAVRALRKAAQDKQKEWSRTNSAYATAIIDRLRAAWIDREHAAFLADYGADAEDLWQERFANERMTYADPCTTTGVPVRPDHVAAMIDAARHNGFTVDGATLADVHAFTTDHQERRYETFRYNPNMDITGFETITIPSLTEDNT